MKSRIVLTVWLAVVAAAAASYGISWATSSDDGHVVHTGPPDNGWFTPDRSSARTVAEGTTGDDRYRVDVMRQPGGELCVEVSVGDRNLVGGCGPAPKATRALGPVLVDGSPGDGERLVVGVVDPSVGKVRLTSDGGNVNAVARAHSAVAQKVFVAKVAGSDEATSLVAQLVDGNGRAIGGSQTLWQP